MSRRAGDLMIPIDKYPHVLHSVSIHEAVRTIENSAIAVGGRTSLPRSLIVFDEEYHPLGIVRRRDILRALEPKFLRTMNIPKRKQLFEMEVDPDLVDIAEGRIGKAMIEQGKAPVSEIMKPIVATVDYHDHLTKIIFKMISRDVTMVPVLKENRVVGVVRTVDVFHEISQILDNAEQSTD